MERICIACGMPMNKPELFAMGDTTKDYCVHCASPDGTMQTWEEKVESMTEFVVRTQGLDAEAAREIVIEQLKQLPAWSKDTEEKE